MNGKSLDEILGEARSAWGNVESPEETTFKPQNLAPRHKPRESEEESGAPLNHSGASINEESWRSLISVPDPYVAFGLVMNAYKKKAGVVLWGDSGAGKTTLFRCALNHNDVEEDMLSKRPNRRWRWMTHRTLEQTLMLSNYRNGLPDEIKAMFKCDLAIIDNVETALRTGALEWMMETRSDNGLPTWITTTHTQDEMVQRYTRTGARRMYERATVIRVGQK